MGKTVYTIVGENGEVVQSTNWIQLLDSFYKDRPDANMVVDSLVVED